MKTTLTKLVAGVATTTLLLGACSDDDNSSTARNDSTTTTEPTTTTGSRTIAKGEDINFTGVGGMADQTMDIQAVEEGGQVTGEVSLEPHGSVVALTCADTDTDGLLLLAGQFTVAPKDGGETVGTWMTVAIREGDPDKAFVWFADSDPDTCTEAFAEVRELDLSPDSSDYAEVEDGDDIETG